MKLGFSWSESNIWHVGKNVCGNCRSSFPFAAFTLIRAEFAASIARQISTHEL